MCHAGLAEDVSVLRIGGRAIVGTAAVVSTEPFILCRGVVRTGRAGLAPLSACDPAFFSRPSLSHLRCLSLTLSIGIWHGPTLQEESGSSRRGCWRRFIGHLSGRQPSRGQDPHLDLSAGEPPDRGRRDCRWGRRNHCLLRGVGGPNSLNCHPVWRVRPWPAGL